MYLVNKGCSDIIGLLSLSRGDIMLRLKVTLKPGKRSALKTNYRKKLNTVCKELLKFNRERYLYCSKQEQKDVQLYFSPLFCKRYEVDEGKIIFKDKINWYITCSSYDAILDLIQGFYCKDKIKIGKAELEVISMELTSIEKKRRQDMDEKYFLSQNEKKDDTNEVAIM